MPVLSPSPPSLLTVEEGGDATVECGAQGSPTPSLFWALKGNRSLLTPETKAGRFLVDRSAQGTAVLTIKVTPLTLFQWKTCHPKYIGVHDFLLYNITKQL